MDGGKWESDIKRKVMNIMKKNVKKILGFITVEDAKNYVAINYMVESFRVF
jgi:hypothetical protein